MSGGAYHGKRKHGTGSVRWERDAWRAYTPQTGKVVPREIGMGFTRRHQAEGALDKWIAEHGAATEAA